MPIHAVDWTNLKSFYFHNIYNLSIQNIKVLNLKRRQWRDFPGAPVVKTVHSQWMEAWVQSLVWELRSHMLCSSATKEKKKKNNNGMNINFVLEMFWKERFFQCSSQERNFSSPCQKRIMAMIFFFFFFYNNKLFKQVRFSFSLMGKKVSYCHPARKVT